MKAAYRNSSESKSENSIPCRQPIQPRLLSPQNEHFAKAGIHLGAIAATLDDLVEMGLLETFVDEFRITRYRPTGGRIA
jgi:hypothetical protein